ncbi:ATP-dependent zinc metalloprotease FtsH [subsurface metagenome]
MIKEYGKPPIKVSLTDTEKEEIADAALGLTLAEAEKAFSKSLINDLKLTIDDIQEVLEEKAQVIKKTQILEYFPPVESFKVIGGLELLLQWLKHRREAFSEAASNYGLPSPKGILVVGMPGCGKSLCAKTVSAEWRLPLLRLDMARIFGILGLTPEENLRKAIKTAETIAPCIFWVDEIEKGFPKSIGSASDVSVRLLGHFLTWMQEKTLPVFVFATANDIGNLPPELLRRGRFDEIFFVDFPNSREREAIWRIQFRKYKQNIPDDNLGDLVRLSKGFSGAEIEQCLIDSLFRAFSDTKRPLRIGELKEAIDRMKPLSGSMRNELDKMRDSAETCAVKASTYIPEEVDRFDVGLGREISRRKKEESDFGE